MPNRSKKTERSRTTHTPATQPAAPRGHKRAVGKPPPTVAKCGGCKHPFTAYSFGLLRQIGRIPTTPGRGIASALCHCGSTVSVRLEDVRGVNLGAEFTLSRIREIRADLERCVRHSDECVAVARKLSVIHDLRSRAAERARKALIALENDIAI